MNKRITPEVKKIADAHIAARVSGKWDNPAVATKDEVISHLRQGKTFEQVLQQIEMRFCSIGSLLINRVIDPTYISQSYKSNVYKGFKTLLQN